MLMKAVQAVVCVPKTVHPDSSKWWMESLYGQKTNVSAVWLVSNVHMFSLMTNQARDVDTVMKNIVTISLDI